MALDEATEAGGEDVALIDPLAELRRRERQQAVVAELGRSALLGTELAELVEQAVTAAAQALEVERVGLLTPGEEGLACRSSHGWRQEELRPVAVDGDSQVAEVYRNQEPVVVGDFAGASQYPASAHLLQLGIASGAAVPVRGEGQAIGVLVAHSTRRNAFGGDEVLFLRAVANLIAVVTSRERARSLAEETQSRLSFLAEAGVLLSASLDYRATLAKLAELVVPHFADWCTVVMTTDDGSLERLVTTHGDPGKRRWAEAFIDRYPVHPDDPSGAPAVIRTGEPLFVPEITDAMLVAAATDDDQLQILRELDLRSTIVVPLTARGRRLGALTLATTGARNLYTDRDFEFAQELARRAANAVDNARLYETAEQGARAAQALAYVADAVILVDARGRVRYWNPAAGRLTGVDAQAALGQPVSALIPGWAELEQRLVGGAQHTLPVALRGEERWLAASRVDFAEGSVFALRDLSQERALERMRSDLVATASHELRTPLAAIYGAAVTLLREDVEISEDERRTFLKVIESEGDRLARIINQILVAGQLDDGQLKLRREECDLGAVAASVIETAARALPDGDRLRLHVDESLPLVQCDSERFRQVLGNLLENAVKYSPDGGPVDVSLHRGGEGKVLLEVADRGIGIPASEQERIFEKFHRLDPEQTRGVGGTGLGLYITRELVTRMGGRIGVSSEPGRGTAFTVELPERGA